MKNKIISTHIKKLSPGLMLVLGFALVILIGTLLLIVPFTHNDGVAVSFIDALFTSTSAVCVTGLIAIDTADTFSAIGCTVIALLIQIGGLGVASAGVGLILLTGKKIGLKSRQLVKEALNLNSFKGAVSLVRSILLITLCIELMGAALSYITFSKVYSPLKAIGVSLFHSIAAFNNAGFDMLGGLTNLIPYRGDVLLNLTTCGLIFFGGIGFLVILDVLHKRRFKTLTLQSKVAISMSMALIILGTLLLKTTEDITWLAAFFQSITARTAGFSTVPIGSLTNAGLFVLIMLMVIGASPGSTGGGMKTTTFFALLISMRGTMLNRQPTAFRRSISNNAIAKAFLILLLYLGVICTGTFALCLLEPEYSFIQILFEVVSGFATVGLSTGITPDLGSAAKLIMILIMFIGRLGPLTILLLGASRPEQGAHYTEEPLTIG
ncbi:MAG: H(+)-transporting ATPase [Clostridiales bacterium]|nr:H(+)-transporting ATPase [Clostridiales bacterium]